MFSDHNPRAKLKNMIPAQKNICEINLYCLKLNICKSTKRQLCAVKVNPTNAFFVQVSCFKVLLVRGGHWTHCYSGPILSGKFFFWMSWTIENGHWNNPGYHFHGPLFEITQITQFSLLTHYLSGLTRGTLVCNLNAGQDRIGLD